MIILLDFSMLSHVWWGIGDLALSYEEVQGLPWRFHPGRLGSIVGPAFIQGHFYVFGPVSNLLLQDRLFVINCCWLKSICLRSTVFSNFLDQLWKWRGLWVCLQWSIKGVGQSVQGRILLLNTLVLFHWIVSFGAVGPHSLVRFVFGAHTRVLVNLSCLFIFVENRLRGGIVNP